MSVAGGAGGRIRCPWPGMVGDELYESYHDQEWGLPVSGERDLFERLSLEAFQSGLSWITILRKREAFRTAFANFDPEVVSKFSDDDVSRLMADAAIVRNRAKILAVIANAQAVLDLRSAEGLESLVHSYAPQEPRLLGEPIPSQTPESVALAKALKKRGFKFIGPTTAYAAMQAIGLVNDHSDDCWARVNP